MAILPIAFSPLHAISQALIPKNNPEANAAEDPVTAARGKDHRVAYDSNIFRRLGVNEHKGNLRGLLGQRNAAAGYYNKKIRQGS